MGKPKIKSSQIKVGLQSSVNCDKSMYRTKKTWLKQPLKSQINVSTGSYMFINTQSKASMPTNCLKI